MVLQPQSAHSVVRVSGFSWTWYFIAGLQLENGWGRTHAPRWLLCLTIPKLGQLLSRQHIFGNLPPIFRFGGPDVHDLEQGPDVEVADAGDDLGHEVDHLKLDIGRDFGLHLRRDCAHPVDLLVNRHAHVNVKRAAQQRLRNLREARVADEDHLADKFEFMRQGVFILVVVALGHPAHGADRSGVKGGFQDVDGGFILQHAVAVVKHHDAVAIFVKGAEQRLRSRKPLDSDKVRILLKSERLEGLEHGVGFSKAARAGDDQRGRDRSRDHLDHGTEEREAGVDVELANLARGGRGVVVVGGDQRSGAGGAFRGGALRGFVGTADDSARADPPVNADVDHPIFEVVAGDDGHGRGAGHLHDHAVTRAIVSDFIREPRIRNRDNTFSGRPAVVSDRDLKFTVVDSDGVHVRVRHNV